MPGCPYVLERTPCRPPRRSGLGEAPSDPPTHCDSSTGRVKPLAVNAPADGRVANASSEAADAGNLAHGRVVWSRSGRRRRGNGRGRARRGASHGGVPDQVSLLSVQPAPGRLALEGRLGGLLPEVLGRAGRPRARRVGPGSGRRIARRASPRAPGLGSTRLRIRRPPGPSTPAFRSTSSTSAPKTSASSRAVRYHSSDSSAGRAPDSARDLRARRSRSRPPASAETDPRVLGDPVPRSRSRSLPRLAPAPEPRSVVPPIQIDARPVAARPTRTPPPPRPRDLILPRSVVTAWSLFVLLALGFAFFAGLLAGHFVWKVH